MPLFNVQTHYLFSAKENLLPKKNYDNLFCVFLLLAPQNASRENINGENTVQSFSFFTE